MARPPLENRRNLAEMTLTLRLTRQDRELLQRLVALRAAEMLDSGADVTAASYVRGLIRQQAREKGLLPAPEAEQPAATGSRRAAG